MKLKFLKSLWIFLLSPALVFDSSSAIAKSSGCGSGSSWYLLRIGTPVAANQFRVACNEHDACYDTFGKSRQECDRAFHNRMLGICARDHNTWLGKPLKIACNGRADAYYTAVLENGQDAYDKAQAAAKPSETIGIQRVFIKSAHGNYFLNHTIGDRSISLADQPYNPATGAYDGELWEIVDAGGGRVFIKSAHGNYFLNHTIGDRSISLADQPYNPATGAYDGELWQIVKTAGSRVIIKSAHGNYFLNHTIGDRSISLADQLYNPLTGAYDGELWQIVAR